MTAERQGRAGHHQQGREENREAELGHEGTAAQDKRHRARDVIDTWRERHTRTRNANDRTRAEGEEEGADREERIRIGD